MGDGDLIVAELQLIPIRRVMLDLCNVYTCVLCMATFVNCVCVHYACLVYLLYCYSLLVFLPTGYIPHVSSVPDMTCFSHRSDSESSSDQDEGSLKVDKVYTVGCFDLFHIGHENLLKRMRKLGKEVNM